MDGAKERTTNAARVVRWIAVVAAAVPIPFEINDAVQLELWNAEWWWWLFALGYAIVLSAAIYGLVRGVAWIFGRVVL